MRAVYNYFFPNDEYPYSARELAELLNCTTSTIYNMVKRGKLIRVPIEKKQIETTPNYEDLPNELWEPIKGFPNYFVSSHGRVRRGNKIRKPSNSRGYQQIAIQYTDISGNTTKKQCYVHRLVAEAFLDNWDPELEVDHLDGDPTNNHINNLEMVTHQENMRRARERYTWSKGKPKAVTNITTGEKFYSISTAAKHYGISASSISRCCSGRALSAGGYRWAYIEE